MMPMARSSGSVGALDVLRERPYQVMMNGTPDQSTPHARCQRPPAWCSSTARSPGDRREVAATALEVVLVTAIATASSRR